MHSLESKQNKYTHDKKASIVYRKIKSHTPRLLEFHLRAGLNVAAWSKIIILAECFGKKYEKIQKHNKLNTIVGISTYARGKRGYINENYKTH